LFVIALSTETCNARHYYLNLALFGGPENQDETYRRVLGSGHLDGVIVTSAQLGDSVFPKLLGDGVPFVLAGRHPDERVNDVDVDNVGGARMAVEHLRRLGHQRIATITGPLTMTSGEDRLAGYRHALEAHRLGVDERLIVEGDFAEGGGAMGMSRLLPAAPSAVFVASDVMAIGALKTLREAGRRVSQDVALVGFDDVTIATAVEPALTTVRRPIDRLGAMTADVLLNLLEQPSDQNAPSARPVQRIVLPTELVVRGSCGALL
jgi:DNA-binding LacI/PurR family transcriptional regulator